VTSKNQKSKVKNQTEATQQSKPAVKSSKEPQTMEELLALTGGFSIGVKKGDSLDGTVISISSREVLVDIGQKSYGVVAEWELEQVKEFVGSLKIGDKVSAQVMNPENDIGYVVLSLRKSSQQHRWAYLITAKENGEDIEVTGLELAKGGILVDWQGLRGFVPATQLEGSFASSPQQLLNHRFKVRVLEVDKNLNRLVLSQKASVLGVTPTAQKEKLDKIKPEDVLKGTVSGVASFGIFVDLDGLEGLVHISELAWEKVENPANMFKVGQTVEVMVLEIQKEEGKLNLSIKRLTPDPWKNILDRYPIDFNVKGKVVRQAPYGVFVQLEPGVEGLLHISKIIAGQEPAIGANLDCIIERIDPVKRKISLTLVPTEKPVGYR
jgi:ribosomal protein S1